MREIAPCELAGLQEHVPRLGLAKMKPPDILPSASRIETFGPKTDGRGFTWRSSSEAPVARLVSLTMAYKVQMGSRKPSCFFEEYYGYTKADR